MGGVTAPASSQVGEDLAHSEYDAFLNDLTAKKKEFDNYESGTRMIGDIEVPVGGLIPESYIKLIEQKPKDYDAYQELIGQFYSNAEVYRGGVFPQQIKTNEDVLKLFEQQTAVGSAYSPLKYTSPQSIAPISDANVAASLRQYNDMLTDQYLVAQGLTKPSGKYQLNIFAPVTDDLTGIIQIHTFGQDQRIFDSPFASMSTDRNQSAGWAQGFNDQSKTGVLFSTNTPLDGSLFTFRSPENKYSNTYEYGVKAFSGNNLSNIETELEVLIPGGIRPQAINSVVIYQEGKGPTFSATKIAYNDRIFVVIKDDQGKITNYELNKITGKYDQSTSNLQTQLGQEKIKALPQAVSKAANLGDIESAFQAVELSNGVIPIGGKNYSAAELDDLISNYKIGYSSIYEVPKELGLRQKVQELADRENLEQYGASHIGATFRNEQQKIIDKWQSGQSVSKNVTMYLSPNGMVTQPLLAPVDGYKIEANLIIDGTGKSELKGFTITDDIPETVVNQIKQGYLGYIPEEITRTPRKPTFYNKVSSFLNKNTDPLKETTYKYIQKPASKISQAVDDYIYYTLNPVLDPIFNKTSELWISIVSKFSFKK